MSKFPNYRPRRLRASEALRALVRETRLDPASLVMPYFVTAGKGIKRSITSLEDQYRFSVDTLLEELDTLVKTGIKAILLFGIPETKSSTAREAFSEKGAVQEAIRKIKRSFPELIVIADTCVCAYMSHGHCGMVAGKKVVNDASVELLAKVALSQAEAGADLVAPSDMMDGRVAAIRSALDKKGFNSVAIMSYAAKYSSAFYGPFREAQDSAPQFGDRKTYQMDAGNREEALREIALDIEEGADIVMVKPALSYLDIIREAKTRFQFPLAAFSVSGEYAMIKTAAREGLIDERATALEVATSIRRAGADIIITYHAKDLAEWLKNP